MNHFILKVSSPAGSDFFVSMMAFNASMVTITARLKWGFCAVLGVWRIS